tara:strand:- start:228 stop:392 length:165 start_codon:yes stop_codon:yes gene_type:complete
MSEGGYVKDLDNYHATAADIDKAAKIIDATTKKGSILNKRRKMNVMKDAGLITP